MGARSAFELHASGGVPGWRGRLRQRFPSYNELANGVLRAIDLPMPTIDVGNIPAAPTSAAPSQCGTAGRASEERGMRMRTGANYREALRDGRKVWVMGEGEVDDVTTHPATRALVDEYVAWYDRQRDPEWQETLLAPKVKGKRIPWGFIVPRRSEDVVAMGRSFAKTLFLSAGNATHDPAYLADLIALGVLTTVETVYGAGSSQADQARTYRVEVAAAQRFITYCGGAPIIGQRMRPDPADRVALKLVRETDAGIVVSGRVGMHTSPAYAEDVYIGGLTGVRDRCANVPGSSCRSAGAGVTGRCAAGSPRATKTRSSRRYRAGFDELDGQMWLDEVFVTVGARLLCRHRSWTRSPAGCAGTTSTAGSPRPSSLSGWRWRWPMRWG